MRTGTVFEGQLVKPSVCRINLAEVVVVVVVVVVVFVVVVGVVEGFIL